MKTFLLSLLPSLLFIFFSCNAHENDTSEKKQLMNQITIETADELKKIFALELTGIGGSAYDKIRSLSLVFHIKKPLTKNEARTLLVKSVSIFLAKINNNAQIKPYLINYPFTSKNINLSIISYHKNGSIAYYPFIQASSNLSNGNISFKTASPDNESSYKTKEFETFEEALAIVNKQEAY